jgi:hypothetical protein
MTDPRPVLDLTADERSALACTKATCPFIGSVIAQQLLAVRNEVANPLADIEELRHLGNRGGGDLGNLLAFFALGNHAQMRSGDGSMTAVPAGMFSLDFPVSQGSHPGDSGILQGGFRNGVVPRFDPRAFARLEGKAVSGRLTRWNIGEFIAENIRADSGATTLGKDVVVRIGNDLILLLDAAVPATLGHLIGAAGQAQAAQRAALERLTKLIAEDNLVGSSGEFGLLFALLSSRNSSRNGEPCLLVDELRLMFEQKQLPAGWDSVKATWRDWVRHTLAIASAAHQALADAAR